jgi:hypothetical protein
MDPNSSLDFTNPGDEEFESFVKKNVEIAIDYLADSTISI